MDLNSFSTASTVIPRIRNGRRRIQTRG